MRDEEIEALKKFAREALRYCWEGGDFEGGDIQDTALRLGLLVETKFDPAIHSSEWDNEAGDPWYEYAPFMKDGAARSIKGERSMRDSHLYRKKPVVIQAWQWFCKGHAPSGVGITEHPDCAWIDTLEGTMKVSPGDWIIKGVKGEFYPCKPDIFSATYESVGAETAQEPLNQTSPPVNETGDK